MLYSISHLSTGHDYSSHPPKPGYGSITDNDDRDARPVWTDEILGRAQPALCSVVVLCTPLSRGPGQPHTSASFASSAHSAPHAHPHAMIMLPTNWTFVPATCCRLWLKPMAYCCIGCVTLADARPLAGTLATSNTSGSRCVQAWCRSTAVPHQLSQPGDGGTV